MGKGVILIFVFVYLFFFSKANPDEKSKLDSLMNQLANMEDQSNLPDTYYQIALAYKNHNSDSTLFYFHRYLQTAIEKEDTFSIVSAYFEIADFYYSNDYDSSLYYSKKYLTASLLTNDTIWIADALNFVAYAYNQKGEFIESIDFYQKAFDCYAAIKDSSAMASCYINIGYTLSFGNQQVNGLQYFLKGLHLAESIHDTRLMADANYNIAYYYDRIKDYESAYNYYNASLKLTLGSFTVDSFSIALTYANLAYISLKMNHYDEFISNMNSSKNSIPNKLSHYEKNDIYSSYAENYIESKEIDSAAHYLRIIEILQKEKIVDSQRAYYFQQMGRLCFLKKNYEKSIINLNKSIALFKKTNSIESFSETYMHLAKANAALNKHEDAYSWQLKANAFEDSLNLGAIKGVLTEFEQTKIHDIELQKEKLQLELEKQKVNNTTIQMRSKLRLTIATLILLFIIILIIIFFFRSIQKKNKLLFKHTEIIQSQKNQLEKQVLILEDNENKLQKLNATKDKFFSIIAHDLKNPLHSIIGLSEFFMKDASRMENKDMVKIMLSMNKTANYGFSLLENLLEWSRSQTGNIIPKPFPFQLEESVRTILSNFKEMFENKHIHMHFDDNSFPPVYADKNMINTVLRNLLHNAVKFSFEDNNITVFIQKQGEFLITSIKDEGIGISEENVQKLFRIDQQVIKLGTHKEKGSGLGLILCKEFIEMNNGEISVDCKNEKGCTFSFSLPIYKYN